MFETLQRTIAPALLAASLLTAGPLNARAAEEAPAASFGASKQSKGLVLFDVYWSRA